MVKSEDIIYYNHGSGFTMDKWTNNTNLVSNYDILTTDYGTQGVGFVSSIEHKEYPIYGFQFHPEKNAFEWRVNASHSSHAIQAM